MGARRAPAVPVVCNCGIQDPEVHIQEEDGMAFCVSCSARVPEKDEASEPEEVGMGTVEVEEPPSPRALGSSPQPIVLGRGGRERIPVLPFSPP